MAPLDGTYGPPGVRLERCADCDEVVDTALHTDRCVFGDHYERLAYNDPWREDWYEKHGPPWSWAARPEHAVVEIDAARYFAEQVGREQDGGHLFAAPPRSVADGASTPRGWDRLLDWPMDYWPSKDWFRPETDDALAWLDAVVERLDPSNEAPVEYGLMEWGEGYWRPHLARCIRVDPGDGIAHLFVRDLRDDHEVAERTYARVRFRTNDPGIDLVNTLLSLEDRSLAGGVGGLDDEGKVAVLAALLWRMTGIGPWQDAALALVDKYPPVRSRRPSPKPAQGEVEESAATLESRPPS